MLNGLLWPLNQSTEVKTIAGGIISGVDRQLVFGLTGSQISYILAGLRAATRRPVLIITYSIQQCRNLAGDIASLLPGEEVLIYPAFDLLPYETLAHSNELLIQRITVLTKLLRDQACVIVAPVEALLTTLPPREVFLDYCWEVELGQVINLAKLLPCLVAQGYERVELVEGPGQFSVRGGIIDIFPLSNLNPVRIELFDDEVDSIREFHVTTQRSLEKLNRAFIPPAREMIYQPQEYSSAGAKIKEELASQLERLKRLGYHEAIARLEQKVGEHLEKMEAGLYFEGLDRYSHIFYPQRVSLLNYLDNQWFIAVDEPARVQEYCHQVSRERAEDFALLYEKGQALPSQSIAWLDFEELWDRISGFQVTGFSMLPKHPGFLNPRKVISIMAKAMHGFLGKLEILESELRSWRKKEYAILILAETEVRCQKLLQLLREAKLDAIYLSNPGREIVPGNIIITEGSLQGGFELTQARLVVITEKEIFGQRKKSRRKVPARITGKLEPFADLKVGDYVVHANHGIGRYLGVEKLDIAGIQKDYLLIKYAGEDRLYVPTDQVSQVQKYLGGEGATPKLNKLGGNEWARVKNRVKESVQEMARELIDLYAARQALRGHAFAPDTVWQREFEDAFPYEETPDQLQAIEEIKKDMEQPKPMDRLLCGDVGYGKTEVALRAAFKAVMDGKQVAVLVPTTILAQQHFNTFRERFASFPVKIEMLSRFRSPKEQKETIRGLAKGEVDIVIGTHRLVQGDIHFNDLGLLIIDEEQRFGVGHKEKLKQIRKTVDVLVLTATPIPRTLHMSLTGVRDMSILESPPEDRYPVQTYVVEYSPQVIRDAITRELNRDGQVYFVHNRVNDIEKAAVELQELVPEARIALGHGQMKEEELERVILDFMEGDYDILVCTTIIEIGLDIPNVNTIIINNADQMGLAQLYQLRGRVGRSNRLAYAYLTYRKDKVLTEIAEKRLRAIKEFTEFGSGFKIAMRDLEIRGTGNIFGPEQHGQMLSVGFDMYCRLLEEAVKELQGQDITESSEPSIEIPVNAFIGEDYIADQGTKMEIYKKIMLAREMADAYEIEEELEDRFGAPPEPVRNLVTLAKIRARCYQMGIQNISQHNGSIVIKFAPSHSVTGEQLVRLARDYPQVVYIMSEGLEIKFKLKNVEMGQVLSKIEKFLGHLKNLEDAGQGLV